MNMSGPTKAAITAAWITGILSFIGLVLAAIIGLGVPLVQRLVGLQEPKTVVVVITAPAPQLIAQPTPITQTEFQTAVAVVSATPVSTPAAAVTATPAQKRATVVASVATQTPPMPAPISTAIAPEATLIVQDIPGERPTPEQAVREYFDLIIERKYDVTFSRLTDNYKQNKLSCRGINWRDCPAYFKWADSLTEVRIYDISRLSPLDTTVNRVYLLADIEFVGRFGTDHYQHYQIFLIWNSTQNQWMIDQTTLER